jgi:hypothetical protein
MRPLIACLTFAAIVVSPSRGDARQLAFDKARLELGIQTAGMPVGGVTPVYGLGPRVTFNTAHRTAIDWTLTSGTATTHSSLGSESVRVWLVNVRQTVLESSNGALYVTAGGGRWNRRSTQLMSPRSQPEWTSESLYSD